MERVMGLGNSSGPGRAVPVGPGEAGGNESWADGDRAFARSSKTLIEQIDHELAEARRWAEETGGVTYVDASKVPAQFRHHDRANMAPVLGFAESEQFGQPRQELVPLTCIGPGGEYVWCVYPTDPAVASDFNTEFDAIMRGRAEHCNRLGLWIAMFISVLAVVAVIIGVATALGAGTIDARTTRYAKLIAAIEQHESVGGTKLYGDYQGDKNKNGVKDPDEFAAHGWLHMWKISVDEANRIAKLNKLGMTFTYADRMDRAKSHAMFVIIAEHHSKGESDEVIARRWNGGPDGDSDPNTEQYWDMVRAILEANEAKSSGGGK